MKLLTKLNSTETVPFKEIQKKHNSTKYVQRTFRDWDESDYDIGAYELCVDGYD